MNIKGSLHTPEDAVRVIVRYVSWEYIALRQIAQYRPEKKQTGVGEALRLRRLKNAACSRRLMYDVHH